jgi:hypothetical protein
MKIDIEEVQSVLLEKKIDPVKVAEVVKQLEKVAEELKEDRKVNAAPKQKYEYVVIINDPEKTIKGNYDAWVVQQREGQDTELVFSKLTDAAKNQNDSAKRKKNVIKCFGELFQSLKSKFAKEKGIRIKTKEAVQILVVNGKTL